MPAKGRGWGGARPGAGKKKAATEEYQQAMRDVVCGTVTPEDWQIVTRTALSRAQAGDTAARDWLSSWVMGAPPKTVSVDGDGSKDRPFVFVIE